jgi:hypothetical protein
LSEPPTLNDEVTPVAKLLNLPTKTAWRVPSFGKKEAPNIAPEPLPAFVPPPVSVPVVSAAALPAAGAAQAMGMPDALREPTLDSTGLPAAAASTEAALFQRVPRRSYAGWVLMLMLVSVAALAAMNKDWVLAEAELLKKYLLRGTPAAAAPDEAASAAAAAASAAAASTAASAQALASAELAASVALEASRVASQTEDVASAASAAVTAASAASVPKVEPKPQAETKPKAEPKVAAKPDANPDEVWVSQLPANGYVVQLAAMDTQDDMLSFQRSNAVYAKTRIMRARQKDSGKRYYILVAGPFETKAQADAFMQSSPLVAKGWLRTTKSMQTQFNKS